MGRFSPVARITSDRHGSLSEPPKTPSTDASTSTPGFSPKTSWSVSSAVRPGSRRFPITTSSLLWRQIKAMPMLVTLWLLVASSTAVYTVFVYRALLGDKPQAGSLFFSASDTNLAISVLSQLFAEALCTILIGALDLLRWQLAARPRGVHARAFLQLSSATQYPALLSLTWRNPWGASVGGHLKAALPLAGLFFGSVLKYRLSWAYYFNPYPAAKSAVYDVFAGLIPLDAIVLALVPTANIVIYFYTWTASLLTVSKYAYPWTLDGCSHPCLAVFLPGGLEMVRKVGKFMNETLLSGDEMVAADTIQVQNAPGFLLQYDALPLDFDFDRDTECTLYGRSINDSLQLCSRSINNNQSLAFGWAACPTALVRQNWTACYDQSAAWLTAPITSRINMTNYKMYATTAYRGQDHSIAHVSATSPPVIQPLDHSVYRAIWDKILSPGIPPAATAQDITQTESLVYTLAWLVRLYADMFPDDLVTPLGYLQNWLAIPQQFMIACFEYANYSLPAYAGIDAGIFVLPADLQVKAMAGASTQRLLGTHAVVWTFIAGAAAAVVATGILLLWVVAGEGEVLAASGIPEVDVVARAGDPAPDGFVALGTLARKEDGNMASSSWKLARQLEYGRLKMFRGQNIFYCEGEKAGRQPLLEKGTGLGQSRRESCIRNGDGELGERAVVGEEHNGGQVGQEGKWQVR